MLYDPIRIVVLPRGRGVREELSDSLGLVDGVKSVEPIGNGSIVWAEPSIDLPALIDAAKEVSFALKLITHRQKTFTVEKKKDDADVDALMATLEKTPGVIRVSERSLRLVVQEPSWERQMVLFPSDRTADRQRPST